jgi:hypothetical protein
MGLFGSNARHIVRESIWAGFYPTPETIERNIEDVKFRLAAFTLAGFLAGLTMSAIIILAVLKVTGKI